MKTVDRSERNVKWWDQRPGICLGVLAVFYLAVACGQALWKLIWADELITFYICQQGIWRGIWQALAAGADPNPPLLHALVRISTSAFGPNAFGMRLPSIACGLLALLAMWWILRRSLRPAFAAAGILAWMTTRGFDYVYDARSYAPLMAFTMAALACWMAAKQSVGPRRMALLAGMAAALAAGISSNYYGVLAFFPIAAGEGVALWQRKPFRPGAWLAMLVAALPLLAYLPLIRHNIGEFAPHAWNRPQVSMIGSSYVELVEGIVWPVLGLAIFSAWKRREASTLLATDERLALWVLLLFPFLGFAVALGGAGMVSPRCVIPVCCGMGLAAGVLGQKVLGGSARGTMAMLALLLLWVGVREGVCASLLGEQRRAFVQLRDRVAALPGSGKILTADSSLVLPLYFYSGPTVQQRLVIPIDFEAIHRFEKDDSGEQNLWAGRKGIFPMPIVPPDQIARDVDFALGRPDGWLAQELRARGFRLTEQEGATDWTAFGGVFTPMAHQETRLLTVAR